MYGLDLSEELTSYMLTNRNMKTVIIKSNQEG